MSKEEILKKNYMQLPDACEEDWQVGSKDEMHQCILTSMEEYATLQCAAQSTRIKELEDGLSELVKWHEPDGRWNYTAAVEKAKQLLNK
jgi:hypothetical protein